MTGICLLVLVGVAALVIAACRESEDITENTPPTPPTKDAYNV